MENIYKLISQRNLNVPSFLVKVIGGNLAGENCLILNGKPEGEKENSSFFTEIAKICPQIQKNGVIATKEGRVYIERLGSRKKMVICGAGHVSMAVITLGKMLGFYVTVIDDRPLFAGNAKRQGADLVICEDFTKALEDIDGDPDTYFIVVTRGHRYDTDCLRMVLKKNYAYVGMMGSRRRVGFVKQALKEEGYDPQAVDRIYTPIGLSIGAETPEEIAVSIMAEIIEIKNKEKSSGGFSEDALYYLSGQCGEQKRMVLATIVSRQGSAPRSVGTKMLIFPDGKTFDTIGGGCVEADVIRHARYMLNHGEHIYLSQIDMREDNEAESGMVCGGVVEVFMEAVENQ